MELRKRGWASKVLQFCLFLFCLLTPLGSRVLMAENHETAMHGKDGQAEYESKISVLKSKIAELNEVIQGLRRQMRESLARQKLLEVQISQNAEHLKNDNTSYPGLDVNEKNSSENLKEKAEILPELTAELNLKCGGLQAGEAEWQQRYFEASHQLSRCEERCFEFQTILEKTSKRCEKDKKELEEQVWRHVDEIERQEKQQHACSSGECPGTFWCLLGMATVFALTSCMHG